MKASQSSRWFPRYALFTVAYTSLVVLLGAVVRITGSGAGCGQHWPTCRGEVLPLEPALETAIEFSHRVTSGLSFFAVLALVVWARRFWPKRSETSRARAGRRFAAAAMAFMLVEVLVGALLVLRALVGDNDTLERAAIMAIHLVNTLLLLGCLVLCTYLAYGGESTWRAPPERTWFVVGLAALLLAATTGAVTALGDTVLPVEQTRGTLAAFEDVAAAQAPLLAKLRLIHPAVAALTSVLLLGLASARLSGDASRSQRRALWWVVLLVVAQLIVGVTNIVLGAPAWLQVVHLVLALGLWFSWLLAWACGPAAAAFHGSARAA